MRLGLDWPVHMHLHLNLKLNIVVDDIGICVPGQFFRFRSPLKHSRRNSGSGVTDKAEGSVSPGLYHQLYIYLCAMYHTCTIYMHCSRSQIGLFHLAHTDAHMRCTCVSVH